MHVPYRDSCHFAIMKAFMAATNFDIKRLPHSSQFGVGCMCTVTVSEGKVPVVYLEIAE